MREREPVRWEGMWKVVGNLGLAPFLLTEATSSILEGGVIISPAFLLICLALATEL
jgi:hypothetical protein